jgi:predicted nicotinamide N-methyase
MSELIGTLKKILIPFLKNDTMQTLSLQVVEELDAHYSAYTWPCSLLLSTFVTSQQLSNSRVLEMGSGTGLCSLVSSKYFENCQMIATDYVVNSLKKIQQSATLNKIQVITRLLDWQEPETWLDLLHEYPEGFDILLGADIFYEPSHFPDTLALISFLLHHSKPGAVCWLAYQERSAKRTITSDLEKWNLIARPLRLDERVKEQISDVSGSLNSIFLIELRAG